MGMADQEQEWRPRNNLHAQSRQSSDGRQHADSRCRCVGARVLLEVSKPPRRLPKGMVERRELGRGGQELRVAASCRSGERTHAACWIRHFAFTNFSLDSAIRNDEDSKRKFANAEWIRQHATSGRYPEINVAYLNENYLKLQAGYLFPEVARRVREFCEAHPEGARRLIRCGIGDVTEPLPPVAIEAMKRAIDELRHRESFRGYGPEQGYEFLRST